MPDTFQSGTDWQDASGPYVTVEVQEADCWPVDDRSNSGTKDQLDNGLHPVIAIGDRDDARRSLQTTGVVTHVNLSTLGTGTDRITLNIADGFITRQYVANILTYAAGSPDTFETAPYLGQPVFIDDSDDLGEGVTLSLSPLNEDDEENPLAGHLWYCEDEIADGQVGGARLTATFDTELAEELVEQEYCIKLTVAKYEAA